LGIETKFLDALLEAEEHLQHTDEASRKEFEVGAARLKLFRLMGLVELGYKYEDLPARLTTEAVNYAELSKEDHALWLLCRARAHAMMARKADTALVEELLRESYLVCPGFVESYWATPRLLAHLYTRQSHVEGLEPLREALYGK
jgi:hypothetical protein